MSGADAGIELGAVSDYNQRRKEGLGAPVQKLDICGSCPGFGN